MHQNQNAGAPGRGLRDLDSQPLTERPRGFVQIQAFLDG